MRNSFYKFLYVCFPFFTFIFPSVCSAKDVTVAFFVPFMSVLGSQTALFDYADFNEKILGNKSIIINNMELFKDPNHHFHLDYDMSATIKFMNRFGDRFYNCYSTFEREDIIRREHVDIFYALKGGENDGNLSTIAKNAVHAIYPHSMQVHGDAYACISRWVSSQHPEMNVPIVPHIVRLHETKENLRKELGIPDEAIVFGRHGSLMGLDIVFVKQAIEELAKEHPDWYFVFLFTRKFCDLPNVIYLPVTADMEYKTKFINTCDAMIHGRNWGETFGLSIAEFSLQNKPVITCSYVDIPYYGLGHLELLGEKGLYYTNKRECIDHINWIAENIEEVRKGNWDCCSEKYSPEVVMKKFDEVFIQPLMQPKASY